MKRRVAFTPEPVPPFILSFTGNTPNIVSDVVAISRIKNAAQNTPTSLLRIDFSNETARDDLLQKRKLIVTPFAYPVIEYIPSVKIIRCFKCQQLGHYANECNNQIKCGKYSGNHGLDNCTNTTLNCPNCGDAHKATYPGCKVRLQYINNIKAKSYAEALSAAPPHHSSQNSQQHPPQSNQQTTTVALRPSISTTNETNLLNTLNDISKSSVTIEINQIKCSLHQNFSNHQALELAVINCQCLLTSFVHTIVPIISKNADPSDIPLLQQLYDLISISTNNNRNNNDNVSTSSSANNQHIKSPSPLDTWEKSHS
ncbi:unnamed protein product [Didymodactylos carnosus]|uniref:CCHC-type domain-containing protein n=1 Tax=Didymodactylos carnosus TaxID=1234261 RepID=A0A815VGE2_9BILA|nr:unnamed protein product [Didymodactylos carnosus]CAF4394455.1 unnamed protein product [Didymodactylos carnosus]